jgi:hypothetical protein
MLNFYFSTMGPGLSPDPNIYYRTGFFKSAFHSPGCNSVFSLPLPLAIAVILSYNDIMENIVEMR